MACKEGDTKCIGPNLYVCESDWDPVTGYTTNWVLARMNAPECAVEPPPPVCTPDDQKCIGPDLYQCSREGQWELVEGDSPQCWVEPPPPETFHLDVHVPSWAAGGYIDPGSGDYSAYSTVRLTAHPLSGYQFTGWGGDASGTSLTYNLYMNSDKNVEAYFEKVPVATYHLDIHVPSWAAGGYVEPGSGDYEAYSTKTLKAYPLSGYQFTGWGGDASGTNPTFDLYMDSDKYVEAYFEPVPVEEFAGTISKKELEYDETRRVIPVY